MAAASNSPSGVVPPTPSASSGPSALPLVPFALYALSSLPADRLEADERKVIHYHVMQLCKAQRASMDDFVFAATEAFRVSGDLDSLAASFHMFVADKVGSADSGLGVGMPIVTGRSGHAGARVLASDAAPSASSPLHVVLAERERMLLQRRSIARGESGRLLERGESDAHGFGGSSAGASGSSGSSNHHDRVLGRDGKHALLDHADTFGGSRGSFSAHPLPVTLIYYAPEMADVAAELARGPAAPYVRLRRIDWGRFPDGWPNLFIHDIKDTRFHTVVFLASFHDQAALTTQLHVIYTLPSYARRLNVVIPWFPTGTMERISTIGEVPTAKTVASMLSATPTAAAGPPLFQILDVHALQTQFYFEAGVHVRLKSCVSLLVDRLLRLPDVANVRIAFPDDGAAKRFKDKFDAFGEPVICSKRREGDQRRIVISDGDPRGRHVVIVDDLVQSGSTLLECAHALEAHGATAISAYVTHAVFPRESWRKFAYTGPCPAGASAEGAEKAGAADSGAGGEAVAAGAAGGAGVDAVVAEKAAHHAAASSATLPPGGHAPQASKGAGTPSAAGCPGLRLRHFWVTNSIPTTAAALRGVCPFEVLSIAPVIEDMLMGS